MSAPFARKNPPPFGFPAIERKKVVAAFDGGRLTSDGGVLLLGAVERQLGIADTLAPLISDPRNPLYVTHSVSDILRARILAIACGYEDGDDLDVLRTDPGFKVACGRLPDSGDDLCSQPTVSRWENAPSLREVVRMSYAMIDLYCRSYDRPPAAVTFDIDDTCDVVHGNQQLALFHAHYDERCFLPIHVYAPQMAADLLAARRLAWAQQNHHRTGVGGVIGAAYPPPLAAHGHHHSWRLSLRPP
jgi:Transposase DDE domain group 1